MRNRKNHLPRNSRIEEVGEDRGADDHDRVRDQREDDRVLERRAEVRVRPLVGVVAEADEFARERSGRGVRQREVDGHDERRPDEQADEDDRGRDQRRREKAALLEEIASPAPGHGRATASYAAILTVRFSGRGRDRSRERVEGLSGRDARGPDLDLSGGRRAVVFVGPSGCGKTSALRMIAGLEDITDGTIRIGDELVNDLPPKDRDVAMIFQNYALYPHMSIYANMAFALKMRGLDKRRDRPACGNAGACSDSTTAQQEAAHAIRRTAPARRDGSRDRARAARVPHGRAAVEPRREAPRADARRDRAVQRRSA